jgi:hypothetical protein
MTTDMHVDPSTIDLKEIEEANQETSDEDIPEDADIPEGAIRFNLTAREIEEAMLEASTAVNCSFLPCTH